MRLRFLIFILASGLLSSCIAIPISSGERHPFSEERLAFLNLDETGKSEVLTELGKPSMRSDDGSVWVYRKARKGSEWLVVAGSGHMGAADVFGGGSKTYTLVLTFDSLERVGIWAVFDKVECEPRTQVCKRGSMFVFPIDSAMDRHAKQFDASPDSCLLYAYDVSTEDAVARTIYVDDDWIGALIFEDSFVQASAAVGTHTFATVPLEFLKDGAASKRSVDFDCRAGDLIFFRLKDGKVKRIDPEEGRFEVNSRRIAVATRYRI